MKTYFEKNQTTKCKCGEQKLPQEILCFSCANYWASNVGGQNLPFKNSNSSVEWMNAMLNDFFPEDEDALNERACNLIG